MKSSASEKIIKNSQTTNIKPEPNSFGGIGRVICPRGFHYEQTGIFSHGACKFNSSGCNVYDMEAGSCKACSFFYELVGDRFNNTKFCTLGTFWTMLEYGMIILVIAIQCW